MIAFPVHRRRDEPTQAQLESGNYPKRKIAWNGLTLAIENEAESVRRGVKPDGTPWESRMIFPYGYVLGSEGVDGDHVDMFLGPNPDSPMVYVVHQRKVLDWDKFDEDKCCLGYDSEDDAKAAFLACYDDPRFLGPITAMPVAEFVAKVKATRERPAMIKAVLFAKSYVKPHERRLPDGRVVHVDGYSDRRVKQIIDDSQMVLFPVPARAPVPAPFPPEVSEHPEKFTPDLFTGETEAEREAKAKPDLLTADRATYEGALWSAMNARWDAGEEVTYGTSGKGYRVSPKRRGALRFENGKIKFYGGKRGGVERWNELGPNGQAMDSLAQMLRLPTAYQRDTARFEREGPKEEKREGLTPEQIEFRIGWRLGVPEGTAISELTAENLPEVMDGLRQIEGWDENDRADVDSYIRKNRPELFPEAGDRTQTSDVDLEETRNGLDVDWPDMQEVAAAVREGLNPKTGKPFESEGHRIEILSELDRLAESVAGALEYLAAHGALAGVDWEVAERDVAEARASVEASQAVAPVGSELKAAGRKAKVMVPENP